MNKHKAQSFLEKVMRPKRNLLYNRNIVDDEQKTNSKILNDFVSSSSSAHTFAYAITRLKISAKSKCRIKK